MFCLLPAVAATAERSVRVELADAAAATTSDAYVGFTLDWWAPDEGCSPEGWGADASVLRVDLDSPKLRALAAALAPAPLRVGGSRDKSAVYAVPGSGVDASDAQACPPDTCLTAARWDELHAFANATGTGLVFGLSYPEATDADTGAPVAGAWNGTQARALLEYSASRGCARARAPKFLIPRRAPPTRAAAAARSLALSRGGGDAELSLPRAPRARPPPLVRPRKVRRDDDAPRRRARRGAHGLRGGHARLRAVLRRVRRGGRDAARDLRRRPPRARGRAPRAAADGARARDDLAAARDVVPRVSRRDARRARRGGLPLVRGIPRPPRRVRAGALSPGEEAGV